MMPWFVYPLMILGVLLAAAIFTAIRYRPALWRWIFVLEILLLFLTFSNCFIPGSWKQFWIFTAAYGVPAILCAAVSMKLRQKKDAVDGIERDWWKQPQLISLVVVAGMVFLMWAS